MDTLRFYTTVSVIRSFYREERIKISKQEIKPRVYQNLKNSSTKIKNIEKNKSKKGNKTLKKYFLFVLSFVHHILSTLSYFIFKYHISVFNILNSLNSSSAQAQGWNGKQNIQNKKRAKQTEILYFINFIALFKYCFCIYPVFILCALPPSISPL